jgi:hypothetical protein
LWKGQEDEAIVGEGEGGTCSFTCMIVTELASTVSQPLNSTKNERGISIPSLCEESVREIGETAFAKLRAMFLN